MFNAAKDLLTSKAARTYANNLIARYGKVDELTIDSKNRRVRVVCSLDGETGPISVDVDNYRLENVGGKTYVVVEACRCSRRWVETLLIDQVRGKKYELPPWAAAAL